MNKILQTILDLKTRDQLPVALNNHGLTGIGAEVGVAGGGFASIVLSVWKGTRYLAVDAWERQDTSVYREDQSGVDFDANLRNVLRLKSKHKILTPICGYSVDVAEFIKDESLDWVFIDANHSFEAVTNDMDAWYPKVKPGGLFSGHDYYNCTEFPHFCRVKDAVDKWMLERGIFFINTDHSWFSIKP